MSRRIAVAVLATLVTACDRVENPVAPVAPNNAVTAVGPGGTVYSGRATAVDATVLRVNKKICDVGPLPPSGGGPFSNSIVHQEIPGVLIVNLLYCYTRGLNNTAHSESAVAEVILTLPGLILFADILSSHAAALCTNGVPSTKGHSHVARLNINGQAWTITGSVNQTIPLPYGGYVVINQQSGHQNPFSASRTVTALRVVVNGLLGPIADISFARSHADIDCGPA